MSIKVTYAYMFQDRLVKNRVDNALEDLYTMGDFDMVIASDDELIGVHRVVLMMFSITLRDRLSKVSHQNLVYSMHESLPRYIKQAIELLYRGRVTIEPDDRTQFESTIKSWRINGVFRKVLTTKLEPNENKQNQINLISPAAATNDTNTKMETSKSNGEEIVKTVNENGHLHKNGDDATKNHQKTNCIEGFTLPTSLDICRIPMASLANATNQNRPQLMDIQQSKETQRINTPTISNLRHASIGSVGPSITSLQSNRKQTIEDFEDEKSCDNGNEINNNKNCTKYEHDENTKENWQLLGNSSASNQSSEMNSHPIDVDED